MGPLFLCFPLLLENLCRPVGPRPRQSQYGEGRPALKGISISISATVATLRGGRVYVGFSRNQWGARPGCEPQNRSHSMYSTARAPWMRYPVQLTNPSWIPEKLTPGALPIGAPKFAHALRPAYITSRRPGCNCEMAAEEKFLPEVEIHVPDTRLPRLHDGQPSPRRDGARGAKISIGSICRMGCGTCCTDSRTAIRCLGR
jgi:hypothetical protein